MARTTDNNKMKLVKQSLVDIIVKDGSSQATISNMAKKAGVSSGYLYRHYDSKNSLLEELYSEKFVEINAMLLKEIEGRATLYDAILAFYKALVKLAQSNENEILFFLKMMTDYALKIPNRLREELTKNVNLLKDKYETELNPEITSEQLFTQLVGTILIFINMRKRGVFTPSDITQKEIIALTEMALNALK